MAGSCGDERRWKMRKDAFYFSHDSNAKDDPKCMMLIDQLGLEGYGIYWVLIETLREQPGYRYPLAGVSALARKYNTSAQKMEAVVRGFGLFRIEDETVFLSDSLVRRMEEWDETKRRRSLAGKKAIETRWERRKLLGEGYDKDTNVLSSNKECNTNVLRQKYDSIPIYNNIISNNIEDIYKEKEINKEKESGGVVPVGTDGSREEVRRAKDKFEEVRRAFQGRKRGAETEWENFRKRCRGKELETVLEMMEGLRREIGWRARARERGEFVPEWPNLSTWVNQRRWETEWPGEENRETERRVVFE